MASSIHDRNGAADHVLFPAEAEGMIQQLKPMGVAEIGSERWSRQREWLEKLNMQAVVNVTKQVDEFVKELLVSHAKVAIIVHELLAVEVWKAKVFPLLLQQSVEPKTGFPAYVVLYHEATLVGILETVMFYQEVCQSMDDAVLDLLDYCYRHIVELLASDEEEAQHKEDTVRDPPTAQEIKKELEEQEKTIAFGVQVKTVAILRYITDHLSLFPLSVSSRLLNSHDFPCLLVNLVEIPPWTKTGKTGQLLKYEEGKWQGVDPADRLKLTKTEAQVWLALYNLLMNPDCQQKYELTPRKKEILLRLRAHLHQPLLDQIPQLSFMQRYLEQLSLMDPPPAKRDLIIEQVPAMYDHVMSEGQGRWSKIAKKQTKLLFEPSSEQLKYQAQRWVDTYSLDILGTLAEGPPHCSLCGADASKRCSRCQAEWYCGRECQVKHWKRHKLACDMLVQAHEQTSVK